MDTDKSSLALLTVFIVEDSKAMVMTYNNILKRLGVGRSFFANDGKAAITKVKSLFDEGIEPDIFIVDHNMPKMNGNEFIEEIKPFLNPRTKFLMVSAEKDAIIVLKAIEAGISNYLQKPFNEQEFVKRFTAVVKKI